MYEKTETQINGHSIYCCLCTESTKSKDKSFECASCHRYICASCLEDIQEVGLEKCPYCAVFIDYEDPQRPEHSQIKDDIKSMKSWKSLGEYYFQRKNWDLAKFFLLKVLKVNPADEESKKMAIEADFKIRSYY